MSLFKNFHIVSHESDGIFFRLVLNENLVNQLKTETTSKVFHIFCDTLGKALNCDERAKWYNYIQMFVLQKPF